MTNDGKLLSLSVGEEEDKLSLIAFDITQRELSIFNNSYSINSDSFQIVIINIIAELTGNDDDGHLIRSVGSTSKLIKYENLITFFTRR